MFDNKDFGTKLKDIRKSKGYTQENVCKVYKVKDISTISRYENGDLIPTIEQVINFCDYMEISITSLFDTNNLIHSKRQVKNPFNTNTLYIYYKGRYPTTNKTAYVSFKIEIQKNDDYIKLIEKDIKTDKIYQVGTLYR